LELSSPNKAAANNLIPETAAEQSSATPLEFWSLRTYQRRAHLPAERNQLEHPQPDTRCLGEEASDETHQPRRRIINDVATRLQNI